MSEDQLLHLLQQYQRKESEIIEFKEWKTSIPFEYGTTKGSDEAERRRCFYGYCVGIGNEGGGKLIIGVKDTGVIVGTTVQLRDDTKSRIFEKTGQKIEIEKCITYDGKQVLIVYIPSRPKGKFLTFHDVPLMRVDDKLLPMDAMTQRKILLEIEPDWSGLPCMGTTLDDLDERALTFLREKKAEISKDTSYLTCDITTFLNQLSLLTEDGIPNNTCILFIGKQIVAEQKLPAISRYARLYVDEKNDLEDRLTAEQQRSPLLLTIETIMEKIRKYNFPLEDITLFRPDTEYQYSESAIEELLANSLAHRDWTIPLHNEIRQTPFSLCFSNP
jgi:predicted HTH transcriptional regulator